MPSISMFKPVQDNKTAALTNELPCLQKIIIDSLFIYNMFLKFFCGKGDVTPTTRNKRNR